jgi:hypothetical protein
MLYENWNFPIFYVEDPQKIESLFIVSSAVSTIQSKISKKEIVFTKF